MKLTRYIPPPGYWPTIAVYVVAGMLVLAAVYTGLTTAMNQ